MYINLFKCKFSGCECPSDEVNISKSDAIDDLAEVIQTGSYDYFETWHKREDGSIEVINLEDEISFDENGDPVFQED